MFVIFLCWVAGWLISLQVGRLQKDGRFFINILIRWRFRDCFVDSLDEVTFAIAEYACAIFYTVFVVLTLTLYYATSIIFGKLYRLKDKTM